jgi:hypothetical protein
VQSSLKAVLVNWKFRGEEMVIGITGKEGEGVRLLPVSWHWVSLKNIFPKYIGH